MVSERISRVTYRVCKGEGHPVRVIHINNTKVYKEREKSVNSVSVIAEENGVLDEVLARKAVLSGEICDGFVKKELLNVLDEVDMYFSEVPGICSVGKCDIKLCEEADEVQ